MQVLNFRCIQPQYQVLFSNLVGLFWNIYISKSLSNPKNSDIISSISSGSSSDSSGSDSGDSSDSSSKGESNDT